MRRSVPLFLSSLMIFTFITSASAECALVLWGFATSKAYESEGEKFVPTNKWAHVPLPDPWIQQAFTTYDACEQAQARLAPVGNEYVKKFRLSGTNQPVWFATSFKCLPDTIDPREPKGK